MDKGEDLKLKEKSYPKEDPYVIRFKILSKVTIQNPIIMRFTISSSWMKLRYFEFVELFYTLLRDKLLINNCSSIEIYHKSGSPTVTNPSDYFKQIHEFNERQFDFIFVLPKRLEGFRGTFETIYSNSNNLSLMNYDVRSIPITHFETQSTYILKFHTSHVHVDQLKYECSKHFHLPVSCISISLEDLKHNFEHKLEDNVVIHIDDVLNQDYKLYLVVSEEYWEPCFLNAFKYDNYFPICEHSIDALVYLNAYLLYLVSKAHLNHTSGIVTGCLGLLGRISCFPPLTYSLRLLFSKNIISLPHKIALVEGLVTTISLLDATYISMKSSDFPRLWYYLEGNTNASYFEYEQSQRAFIESSANTPFCKEIELHYRQCPQYRYDYITFNQRVFNKSIYTLVSFEHPIELYQKFLTNPFHTGLIRIPFNEKLKPYVFCGRSPNSNLQMIDCYSPFHGRLISFNPFEIETPERFVPSDINKYSKLLIILDISNDMNNTLDGLNYYSDCISNDNVFCQLETALILIEIIIDTLISLKLNYLLGITLVSNNHSFQYGFFVFQDLTLEYCYSVKALRNWIINARLYELPSRPASGGIVSALANYIEKKYTNDTHIFIFTNQHYATRYYGPNVHKINNNVQKIPYRINVILFGKSIGPRFETLCKKSNGKLINSETLVSKSSKDWNDPEFYCSQFREYISFMRDLLTENRTSDQFSSLEEVRTKYKNKLSKSVQFIERHHKQTNSYKTLDSVASAILHQISSYTKNPNPFVTMYSVDEDITQWLLFLKCPPNASFYGTDHILSLTFSKNYLYKPPAIKFLTPILHPNIYPNGKICHPILFEDFVPRETTLKTVIDSILSMLCKPVKTHVINRGIGEYFLFGTPLYDLQVTSIKELLCLKSLPRREQEKFLNIVTTTSSVTPPEYLICPLTKELYNYPVISPDGNTFERSAILECLRGSQKDPISDNPLTEENLFPNYAIADSVFKFKMNLRDSSL